MGSDSKFKRGVLRTQHAIGFSKGYNAILWFIFAGAMFGFVLARLEYLNFNILCGTKPGGSAAPGECYYYQNFQRYHIGIMLHLGGILPAGLLVVFQFTPVIRKTFTLYHRMAGYIILLLVAASHAGALMIARHTFGGDLATQSFIGFLVIITTISLALAIINIKKLQIEEHRAWMLRAWFYFGTIITIRIIQITAASITSRLDPQYTTMSCDQIAFIVKNETMRYMEYPACNPVNSQFAVDGLVVVKATMLGVSLPSIGAAIQVTFGMAGWLALALHAIGVEVYLRLTPRESERLRKISYERQLEKGFKNPGSAGLVRERLGDSEPWTVPVEALARPPIASKNSTASQSSEENR